MPNYVADNNNNNTLNNASLLSHSRFLSPIYNSSNAHEPIDESAAISGTEHMQLANGLSREDGLATANSLLTNSHHSSSPLDNCQAPSQMSYVEHLSEVKLEKASIDDLSSSKLSHPLTEQTVKVKLEPHSETASMEQSIDYLDFQTIP